MAHTVYCTALIFFMFGVIGFDFFLIKLHCDYFIGLVLQAYTYFHRKQMGLNSALHGPVKNIVMPCKLRCFLYGN